jgi:hypothetical protein
MFNEDRLFNTEEKALLSEPKGEISFSEKELEILTKESQDGFSKHPFFDGVEIKSIPTEKIPQGIKSLITKNEGEITTFVAIKIKEEIPKHQHAADREIYFGGANGIVNIYNDLEKLIGSFPLSANSYSVVPTGGYHDVILNGKNGSTFFGVKFIPKK